MVAAGATGLEVSTVVAAGAVSSGMMCWLSGRRGLAGPSKDNARWGMSWSGDIRGVCAIWFIFHLVWRITRATKPRPRQLNLTQRLKQKKSIVVGFVFST